jgi:outer membrane protein
MKNSSLVLNGLLFVLVGILYYLHFSGGKSTAPEAIVPPVALSGGGVKIAYVNTDTLFANYQWYKDQKTALEQRIKSAENSLISKQQDLEKDMAAFKQKDASGNYPPAQLQPEYDALMKRAQALAEEEARLTKQLSEQEAKAANDLIANIETQLKNLQSQIGYDYILSYARGGGQVLLTNDSLDITRQVLQLLNAQQQQQ